jgi:predicted nucleotidyltransferase
MFDWWSKVVTGIESIKAALSGIAPRYGVNRVFLFGSQARGDASDISDVDLLVELGAPLGFKRGRLCLEVEAALGTPVDLIFGRDSLYAPMRVGFERDAVVVYERH